MSSNESTKRRKVGAAQFVVDLTADDADDNDKKQSRSKSETKPSKKESNVASAAIQKTPSDDNKDSKKSSNKNNNVVSWTIISYNLWFEDLHVAARMERIAQLVLTDPPRMLGMQEVTPQLSQTLFPLLESTGYQILQQDEARLGYGCAMALQVDNIVASGFLNYSDSIMSRGLLWAVVSFFGGGEVLFATTHLESFVPRLPPDGRTYTGAAQREAQLRQCRQFVADQFRERSDTLRMAILTGDMNWDDERPRSAGLDRPLLNVLGEEEEEEGWIDAWKQHRGPNEAGYTYDARENPMLGGNLRRRFDRCLIRSRGNVPVDIQETELIGRDSIAGLTKTSIQRSQNVVSRPVLPSDHYGLRVRVQATIPKAN